MTPGFGELVEIVDGQRVRVVIAVRGADQISEARVNGAATAIDDLGLITAEVNATFGIQTVQVDLVDDGGLTTTQLCSFMTAPEFVSEGSGVPGTIVTRLNDSALFDGDGMAMTIETLEDIILRAAENGLIDRAVAVEFPMGPQTVPPPMGSPFRRSCSGTAARRMFASEARTCHAATTGSPSRSEAATLLSYGFVFPHLTERWVW